jgi:predicted lipoprotein with Yx(FWY)xxD motif
VTKKHIPFGSVIALAVVLAACGGGGGGGGGSAAKKSSTTAAASTTTPASTSSSTTTSAPAAANPTLKTASSSLGAIVVSTDGKTLYAFANDQGTTSACTGGCATIWPPLKATGTPTGGSGIDASKLSTNAAGQVVYNGHPLYNFSGDSAAGTTNGQGIGGFFAVSPAGEPIT